MDIQFQLSEEIKELRSENEMLKTENERLKCNNWERNKKIKILEKKLDACLEVILKPALEVVKLVEK